MWPFRRKRQSPTHIPNLESATKVVNVLTPEEQVSIGGIPKEAIAGVLDGWKPGQIISPEMFRPNPAFLVFMQQVIESLGPSDLKLRAGARQQGNGSIGIVDHRTPEGIMQRRARAGADRPRRCSPPQTCRLARSVEWVANFKWSRRARRSMQSCRCGERPCEQLDGQRKP